ncbi:MAG: ATPase [Chlamydiae bacterium CG10_big_fil_rev_8_21_14_0_10_35_9]|nr:MAG: ATPase [Chlamydiae bacterium CG10_big_fil_rev_8_21_14_0_10_35_9]
MRKTFVLDTNVLLHDPRALKKFKDNDVVIPLIVLEELDNYKKHHNELGQNAREVIRYIDSFKTEHKSLQKGIQLPEGPKLRVQLNGSPLKYKGFPLPLDRNSNKILMMAYELHHAGEKVVFVSKDFVSRVKAEAMSLNAEDYSALHISFDDMHRGVKKMHVEKAAIDLFYKDGKITPMKDFLANEYCILQSAENSSAVCKFNQKLSMLEPLIHIKKDIWGIQPLNVEQKCAVDLLIRDDIPLVSLLGPAGTGKTLMALACGMRKVFDENTYSKILVSRPIVPLGKDIGYLPGTKEEKLYHWMQPIYDNLEVLCQNINGEDNGKSTMEWVMESGKIEMEAVTYIRGRTLPKIYMIIDEAQNLTPHEMKTIISRAGRGTKVILTGDPTQIDNPYLDKDSNGLTYTIGKFKDQRLFGCIYLDKTERSDLAALAAEIM